MIAHNLFVGLLTVIFVTPTLRRRRREMPTAPAANVTAVATPAASGREAGEKSSEMSVKKMGASESPYL